MYTACNSTGSHHRSHQKCRVDAMPGFLHMLVLSLEFGTLQANWNSETIWNYSTGSTVFVLQEAFGAQWSEPKWFKKSQKQETNREIRGQSFWKHILLAQQKNPGKSRFEFQQTCYIHLIHLHTEVWVQYWYSSPTFCLICIFLSPKSMQKATHSILPKNNGWGRGTRFEPMRVHVYRRQSVCMLRNVCMARRHNYGTHQTG